MDAHLPPPLLPRLVGPAAPRYDGALLSTSHAARRTHYPSHAPPLHRSCCTSFASRQSASPGFTHDRAIRQTLSLPQTPAVLYVNAVTSGDMLVPNQNMQGLGAASLRATESQPRPRWTDSGTRRILTICQTPLLLLHVLVQESAAPPMTFRTLSQAFSWVRAALGSLYTLSSM